MCIKSKYVYFNTSLKFLILKKKYSGTYDLNTFKYINVMIENIKYYNTYQIIDEYYIIHWLSDKYLGLKIILSAY